LARVVPIDVGIGIEMEKRNTDDRISFGTPAEKVVSRTSCGDVKFTENDIVKETIFTYSLDKQHYYR
jgi:hypothetical protein